MKTTNNNFLGDPYAYHRVFVRILIVEKERDDLISVHKAELSKTQAKSEESAVVSWASVLPQFAKLECIKMYFVPSSSYLLKWLPHSKQHKNSFRSMRMKTFN